MNKLLQPLTHEELALLDDFLNDRGSHEEEDDQEADAGVLSISELDGMLTALVSAPTLVKTADWIPAVWGDEEPDWQDEDEFDSIVHLMQRHMNTLAATLQETPEELEPLFLFEEEDGTTFTIVDDWCEGYLRGVNLAVKAWNAGKPKISQLLSPIRAFSSETDWRGHELPEAESDTLSDQLAPNMRAIYRFWHSQ